MSAKRFEREVERQLEQIRAAAEEIPSEDDLRAHLTKALHEGRPLRVKLGVDPSAPDLHLGHTVVLNQLRTFQQLGHLPIFLVGDFTGRIGDPSGRKKTRPALDAETVKHNAETYLHQVGRILDLERVEVRFNSEWMTQLSVADFIRLCSTYTVARLLERDDFAQRYRAEEPIAVHEFLYPFVQAYDSVALRADVELGGRDQRFNLLMAREIQRSYGQPPQAVVLHPLLVGVDGREKMSKSLGNAIGIAEAPEEIYGKTMSISDETMLGYFDLLSAGEWEDLRASRAELAGGRGDPFAFKQLLAQRLVERFHGPEAAEAAERHFRRVVREGGEPEGLPERPLPLDEAGALGLLDILQRLGMVESRGEGRRLVSQGAVRVNGEPVADAKLRLGRGCYLIRAGRRRFARIRLE
jgi:tyrosyl-tRNA synthetase